MLELKPKKKLLSQRNKNWIENVQSPLCLILLTICSPKNHFFSEPDSQLLLAQGISHRSRGDSAGSQLWPLTGRRPPKEHLLFLLCPALPAPPLWLTWLIFLSRLPSVTTRSTYHGAPALHPSLAVFIFLMLRFTGNSPGLRATARCVTSPSHALFFLGSTVWIKTPPPIPM